MIKKKRITTDFEKSSQIYFNEINKYKSLSRDEEASLWEKYKKDNDLSARDKIINSNLKFVASVAKQFQGLGLSYADLIAEGNVGLMKAIDKFDYKRGYKTISYSVWWIRQTILEALKERNLINGDEFPEDYEKPVYNANEDDYHYKDNSNLLDDSLSEKLKTNEEKKTVELLFDDLSEKEKNIVTKYFGLDGSKEMTLEEIGKLYGLTKERVRQIKCNALKKMRSAALSFGVDATIYE
jgi:RNA polymerase primary sigma factor